jgi:hypothetical protein
MEVKMDDFPCPLCSRTTIHNVSGTSTYRVVYSMKNETLYGIEFLGEKKFSREFNGTTGTTSYNEETEPGK